MNLSLDIRSNFMLQLAKMQNIYNCTPPFFQWKSTGRTLVVCLSLIVLNSAAMAQIDLQPLGTYQSGLFDESAAEIVAHDPNTQRLYVVNANSGNIDVLDLYYPANPTLLFQIDTAPYGDSANSVAVHNGIVAVAVQADPSQAPGTAVFFNPEGEFLSAVSVGALPDMLTFTPNGQYVLVANEGEPDEYCLTEDGDEGDPEGSVSVISLMNGVANLTQDDVHTADFSNFTRDNIHPDIRIFGPEASVAQDLEPEYITVDADSSRAWVALQENNAIAVLDIGSATITEIFPLGYKDYAEGGGLDPSDTDDGINIANWPVRGIYQPDAIAAFQANGETFIITTNEGDARDYECFSEEVRVDDLTLDPTVFDDPEFFQQPENLGRLKTTTATGDADGDGQHETIVNYGARSFSIWSADGQLVFDSGSDFEQYTAELIPGDFNSTNDENDSFDNRSDDKGPEPEGIAIGHLRDRVYAFIGFERVGGIIVYDVTDPYQPMFVQYVNNRDFAGDAAGGTAGDLGPEGMLFISAENSPTGTPLLVTANEVSGTTTIFSVTEPVGKNAFTVDLAEGLNMISVPLKPTAPYTARSLMNALSSTVLIRYNTESGRFDGITAEAPDDGFEISGGQAYIVNVPQPQTFTFIGSMWRNLSATAAAPTATVNSTPSAWAFVVSGFLNMGSIANTTEGYTVSVTNRRTNATVMDTVQHGYFAAVFGDLTQKAVVQIGDVILVQVLDAAGNIIGEPTTYTVTSKMIETAFISLALQVVPHPETTVLLQNYPNPFNPETWIPYQLSEAADVGITIYDVTGNVVRSLNLGHQAAGYYRSRSQAAYWDGRNTLNEKVASGVYFYQIQAGQFSATCRMLILK